MKRQTKTNLRKLAKQDLVNEMLANVTGGFALPPVYAKCGNDSEVGPIPKNLNFDALFKVTCIAR